MVVEGGGIVGGGADGRKGGVWVSVCFDRQLRCKGARLQAAAIALLCLSAPISFSPLLPSLSPLPIATSFTLLSQDVLALKRGA